MKLPLLAFIVLVTSGAAAPAQDTPKAVSLFDGKTLAGWDYDPEVWRVEDGLITGGSTTEKIKENFFIATEKSYENFELKLTIKCSGDPATGMINSGIQIRSVRVPGGNHMSGYQVDCGKGWFGKIYDEFRRRKVVAEPVDAAALEKVVDVYGWNEYRIRAEGPRIRVWINGVLATDFTEDNPNIALDGRIAPQVHSGGVALVQVKDVTVEELPATPGAPTWESLGGVEAAMKLAPPDPRPKGKAKAPPQEEIPSPPKGADRVNFDFETGDPQGWFIAEGWFGHPVANNKLIRNGGQPMNKEGQFYLGTLEAGAGAASDKQTGILESPVFQLSAPIIQFAVSGGRHDDTYVGLYTLDGKEVRKASAHNSEIFSTETWNVPDLEGKPVFVRLVDQRQGGWGHIVLDAFTARGKLLPDETRKRQAAAKPRKPAAGAAPPLRGSFSSRDEAWSPAKELAGFTVPPGFVIELVASEENGVINPIDISFDDAGRLWTQTGRMYPLDPISGMQWKEFLALMEDGETQNSHPEFKRIKELYQLKTKGEDKILILDDPTREAKGPLHVWADGLSIPQSVLPCKDGAYVAHGAELFLLRDTDGDDKSDRMEPVLSGFGFSDTHTMSHLLIRGPGGYVHFSQGALNKGMVTAAAAGKQARVDASCQVRFTLDGRDFEVLSAGPSNMWGLQLRADGQWYGTEANDRAYSVMPWEHGTAVTGAAFHPMRPYQPLMPELHKFRVGGTGISGLEFSEDGEGGFPAEWKDVALLANPITSTINAVRIHRNPNGTVEAEHLPDFLTATDSWFRPVNLEFGPDGCLYVADFYNKIISHNEVTTDHPDRDHSHGRIWRIRHESQPERAIPNVAKASPAELLAHLQAPILWEKRAAWQQIADRKLTQLAPALVDLAASEKADAVTRIHALWSLEELGHFDAALIDGLLVSKNDSIRREALRSLASFDIKPAEVASRLGAAIEDKNCMIRSQAIRTLGDLDEPDPAVMALLVTACKPALDGNAMGGSYERNHERFLARMALEKFPAELKNYLATASDRHPGANLLWAIQALDDDAKKEAFLGIWNKVSGQEIDSETFVAIAGMLGSPDVYKAVAPAFRDPSQSEKIVRLALANQSRVQSQQLAEMLTPVVSKLLKSPDTLPLALGAVAKFKMAGLSKQVAAIDPADATPETLRLLLGAQSASPGLNAKRFKELASQEALPFDLRLDATHALAVTDKDEAYRLAKLLLDQGDSAQESQVASVLSQSAEGGAIMCNLFKGEAISIDAIDISSAERLFQTHRRSPEAGMIFGAVTKRLAEQKRQAKARIHDLMAFVRENPGDPAKGRMTFTTCLACHKVGAEGQDVGPPLDGSGHRELEHLLTAIVDPDAAVEGGYGVYRITRTDGSVVEGLLDKEEPLGTTVALMGGARVFVPLVEIKNGSFAGGRSFMPPMFGQLPEETMADLVAYIATLKESPAAAPAPQAQPRTENREPGTGAPRPNVVIFFTDDQGYNDVGCFGSPLIETPHLDQMAAEGLKLTSFYAQPVCGVSRAALMTGSYPIRVGEPGNRKNLHTVLHPEEITLPEVLRDAGYATGIVGKWHLAGGGRGASWNRDLLPNAQGFDYWFGAPSHNGTTRLVPPGKGHAELMRNGEIVDPMVDQEEMGQLTKQYTEEALKFIRETQKPDRAKPGDSTGNREPGTGNTAQPFFLYLAHTMPHVPINASKEFLGKSKRGLYGDVIEELDWSMGQILAELKRLGLDENTIVVFTTDNGPWVEGHLEGEGGTDSHCGSANPLRGWKMSAWEGGCRVPFIARWPGKIPAGRVSDELLSTMDFLPTFASLAGAELPAGRKLDGHDATRFLLGKTGASPRNDYLYYAGCLLTGVREDRWKLVRPRPGNPPGTGWWGRMIEEIPDFELYDLTADPGETKNVATEHPEIVARLKKRIELARIELGDIDVTGKGARLFDEGPRVIGEPKKTKPEADRKRGAEKGI